MRQRRWAAVQDMRPFGLRIEKTFRSRIRAEAFAWHYWPLLRVMPTDEAIRRDKEIFEALQNDTVSEILRRPVVERRE